jgi:selenocysteine lyase/cysteine desulfurase
MNAFRQILDSKWVLGRLLGQNSASNEQASIATGMAVLETHCFRGISGFQAFSKRVQLPENPSFDPSNLSFRDLVPGNDNEAATAHSVSPPNWWVVKDDKANGAGGIAFVTSNVQPDMLNEDHDYVAQRYSWPPVLYAGRKCHVRVYGLLTSDGRAFVHQRCFLHVANEPFANDSMEDTVHITNCCANSHDLAKFAGEICADLQFSGTKPHKSQPGIVGLADYGASIEASMRAVAKSVFPFVRGGSANSGFEYLGLDFILSHDSNGRPVAYLLEINAPPSQDSATGLSHAEDVHNSVMRDLLSLWVFPSVLGVGENPGGWKCVHKDVESSLPKDILPSKAAILNRIRWTLRERNQIASEQAKALSNQQACKDPQLYQADDAFAHFARYFFPYFHPDTRCAQPSGPNKVYFENAGGTQVPQAVVTAMTTSLSIRHRESIGSESVKSAKTAISRILGAEDDYYVFCGPNASTLLYILSLQLGLHVGDEIILDVDNHLANVRPWLRMALTHGVDVTWWDSSNVSLETLVSARTKIVAATHVSNITGRIKDLTTLRKCSGLACLIVDGVAAVPHLYASLDGSGVDFYVVSTHKVYGPHCGFLAGRHGHVEELGLRSGFIETGTINYEACAGIVGVQRYFSSLSAYQCPDQRFSNSAIESSNVLVRAYNFIKSTEAQLVATMLHGLKKTKLLRLIGSDEANRLPMISFVHEIISSKEIVEHCHSQGFVIRYGTFLSNPVFQNKNFIAKEGVVRISLAHYNTLEEVYRCLACLAMMPHWF